ncbi:hypothetical protein CRYUN_Cryun18bG0104500 [Craigia yunnanensis]
MVDEGGRKEYEITKIRKEDKRKRSRCVEIQNIPSRLLTEIGLEYQLLEDFASRMSMSLLLDSCYFLFHAFREELLPMADIITPNLNEASALLDGINWKQWMTCVLLQDCCIIWAQNTSCSDNILFFRNVFVKCGDPDSSDAVDFLYNGHNFYELRSPRIKTRNTHGTGCSLASCIAAELVKGYPMLLAVKVAKCFVETALEYSKEIVIGNGPQGPFDHLLRLKSHSQDFHRLQAFNPSDLCLYVVTDSGMNKKWGRSIADAVKAAIEGGATIFQLR